MSAIGEIQFMCNVVLRRVCLTIVAMEKAVSITYSVCVFVCFCLCVSIALVTQYAKAHAPYHDVYCYRNFSTLSLEQQIF
jgi:hypothetical protein